MSGDPTALSKAIKTWACEEMLKRIVSILGLSDGDDPVEAVRRLKRRVAELEEKLEAKDDILCGIYADTEMHTAEVEPHRMVRDVMDQLVAAESRVEELERERLRHLEDSKRDALTVAVRQVGEAINAQNRLLRVALDQQWPLWNIESRDR